CANCADPVVNPNEDIQYQIIIRAGNSCSATDSLHVTVYPLPEVTTGRDRTMCAGDETQLQATSATAVSYQWTPAAGLSNAHVSNPTAAPNTTTQYSVSVTDANGCTASNTLNIEILQQIASLLDSSHH